ncbi:MAG: aldo/keto reductase [Chlamydiae bacterium]|nr:aldo/keto reductase [Chlamydiota bacterium]
MEMALLGLGTYELQGKECTELVKKALNLGYTHIDTAHAYENHRDIAKAIAGKDRSSLFITSKFFLDFVDDSKIDKSIEESCDLALKELKTNYLDLYLIHWPNRNRPLEEILKSMQKLVANGKIRHAGVSNYTIHHLQDALDVGLKIYANQVEFHPYLNQEDLLQFCNENGIKLIAYRPFGKGDLLKEEPKFNAIGKKYNKTGGQIVLRWLVQKGIAVIPKTTSISHLKENMAIFDFELKHEDMKLIDSLNKNKRYCDTEWSEFNY